MNLTYLKHWIWFSLKQTPLQIMSVLKGGLAATVNIENISILILLYVAGYIVREVSCCSLLYGFHFSLGPIYTNWYGI